MAQRSINSVCREVRRSAAAREKQQARLAKRKAKRSTPEPERLAQQQQLEVHIDERG